MARRDTQGFRARVAAAVGAGLVMAAACGPAEAPDAGPADRGTGSDAGTSTAPQSARGVLDASITTVGSSLRIAWTVTNASGGDLVVFDDRRRTRPRAASATVRS